MGRIFTAVFIDIQRITGLKMYNFTNKEYEELVAAVIRGDYVGTMLVLTQVKMHKSEQTKKNNARVNRMRKINKFYGRSRKKEVKM